MGGLPILRQGEHCHQHDMHMYQQGFEPTTS